MKKLVIFSLFFLLVAVSVTTSSASEKTRQITGNVTAIDTSSNTITVKKKSKTVTLNLGEKTRIIQCTNKPSITDIKLGDKVTAKYKETGGRNSARSITIKDEETKGD